VAKIGREPDGPKMAIYDREQQVKSKDFIEQFNDALKPGINAQEQQLPPKMRAVRVLLDAEDSHLEALAVRLSKMSLDEEFVLLGYRGLDEKGKLALRDELASRNAEAPVASSKPADQRRSADQDKPPTKSDLARYMPNFMFTGPVENVADSITVMNIGTEERR
jgi:hypothetical protein